MQIVQKWCLGIGFGGVCGPGGFTGGRISSKVPKFDRQISAYLPTKFMP